MRFQLAVEAREIARHHRADIGVQHGCGRALVLAPFRRDVDRARDKDARCDRSHHLAHPLLVAGVAERPEEADRDGVAAGGDELADRALRLDLVERHDDLAEAVDALGNAMNEALRHDRIGLLALREVDDLGDVARGDAARAAHDVDRVLVALGRDQADLRALALDQRVGADGRAMRQDRDPLAEGVERQLEPLGRNLHGGKHAAGEVARCRGGLGGGDVAGAVEDDAVGEGAADVDTDEIRTHCSLLLLVLRRRSIAALVPR